MYTRGRCELRSHYHIRRCQHGSARTCNPTQTSNSLQYKRWPSDPLDCRLNRPMPKYPPQEQNRTTLHKKFEPTADEDACTNHWITATKMTKSFRSHLATNHSSSLTDSNLCTTTSESAGTPASLVVQLHDAHHGMLYMVKHQTLLAGCMRPLQPFPLHNLCMTMTYSSPNSRTQYSSN